MKRKEPDELHPLWCLVLMIVGGPLLGIAMFLLGRNV